MAYATYTVNYLHNILKLGLNFIHINRVSSHIYAICTNMPHTLYFSNAIYGCPIKLRDSMAIDGFV